jgi:hypothetical protein
MQKSFEQQPPIPNKFILQKIANPTSNGNNVIFKIDYEPELGLPIKIDYFSNNNIAFTMKDDGIFPDAIANDYRYCVAIKIDLIDFKNKIIERENKIIADGGSLHFYGHSGTFNSSSKLIKFNFSAFESMCDVPVYAPILDVTFCESEIKKQNSLFITDLAVVEDPARTNNVFANTGNPVGAWTFGRLMASINNNNTIGHQTKDFLREWVKTFTIDQTIISNNNPANSFGLTKRLDVFFHLIGPWVKKAHPNPTSLPPFLDVDFVHVSPDWIANWETYWNQCTNLKIQNSAPFKLMAIVNRIDERGNASFNSDITNAGETRFIFTLIDPTTGKPAFHHNIQASYGNTGDAVDWIGMNVILEYSNPMTNNCDLKAFARQWYDLSSFTLGSADYNDHLQAITDQITKPNLGGYDENRINGSCISQIRTNEKIFDLLIPGQNQGAFAWEPADWELRQFELQGNGFLGNAYVTNTIEDKNNFSLGNSYNGNTNLNINNSSVGVGSWVYGPTGNSINRLRVQNGNYNLPEELLDGSARMYREMTHFYDLSFDAYPNALTNTFDPNANMPNQLAKNIRHQLSLNTCQGCHNGETKTNFTMMMPRGYGQAADYWSTTPDIFGSNDMAGTAYNFSNLIDSRFNTLSQNLGTTYDKYLGWQITNTNLPQNTSNTTPQIVAPFITGRRFSSATFGNWEDDELDNLSNLNKEVIPNTTIFTDNTLIGLFYVNDPSNKYQTRSNGSALLPGQGGNFPQIHDSKNGFNELERRRIDLCKFVNTPCIWDNNSNQIDIVYGMESILMSPLPFKGH